MPFLICFFTRSSPISSALSVLSSRWNCPKTDFFRSALCMPPRERAMTPTEVPSHVTNTNFGRRDSASPIVTRTSEN